MHVSSKCVVLNTLRVLGGGGDSYQMWVYWYYVGGDKFILHWIWCFGRKYQGNVDKQKNDLFISNLWLFTWHPHRGMFSLENLWFVHYQWQPLNEQGSTQSSIIIRQRREGGKKVGVEGRLSVAGREGQTGVSILKPTKPAWANDELAVWSKPSYCLLTPCWLPVGSRSMQSGGWYLCERQGQSWLLMMCLSV